MKTNMRKADVKKHIVALALAAVFALPGVALAAEAAKFPLTPNSGSMEFDQLKRTYEIPNFRIGGKYNLDADPETWRNGGEGGTTLESLAPRRSRLPTLRLARPSATTGGRSSTR